MIYHSYRPADVKINEKERSWSRRGGDDTPVVLLLCFYGTVFMPAHLDTVELEAMAEHSHLVMIAYKGE